MAVVPLFSAVAALLVGAVAGEPATTLSERRPAGGDRLVPYVGVIRGEARLVLQTDGGLAVLEAPPADQFSNLLGRGIQSFSGPADRLTVEPRLWPDAERPDLRGAGLRAEGEATSVGANGERLRVAFVLYAVYADPSGTRLVYDGHYEALPGGTGRFAYAEGAEGLGSGRIRGRATSRFEGWTTDGRPVVIFGFEHVFRGEILVVGSGRRFAP